MSRAPCVWFHLDDGFGIKESGDVWSQLEGFVYFPRSEGTGGEFRLLSFDYIRPFRFD